MNSKMRIALIAGGLALTLLIALPLLVSTSTGLGVGCWGPITGGMGGFSIGWLMPVLSILFLALVVWAVVALVERPRHMKATVSASSTDAAMEMLKARYINGEITREEYLSGKKDLQI